MYAAVEQKNNKKQNLGTEKCRDFLCKNNHKEPDFNITN